MKDFRKEHDMKPSQTPIQSYIEKMDQMGVEVKSAHWILPEEKMLELKRDSKHENRRILREVSALYKDMGLLSKDKQVVKFCKCSRCRNPFHFMVVGKADSVIKNELQWLEIEELSELIEVSELIERGFWNYLAKFNYKNPLPAEASDFYDACNIKLVKEHLERIPYSVLLTKGDEKIADRSYKREVED